MSFQGHKFYEAERHSSTLSHSHFAKDAEFEYLEENADLNNFLLSKESWERFFTIRRNQQVHCDAVIANQIFETCLEKFKYRMDTVQIFHVITDFYAIDATYFFGKLVKSHRVLLAKDLETRLGKLKSPKSEVIGDMVQQTFNLIFKK